MPEEAAIQNDAEQKRRQADVMRLVNRFAPAPERPQLSPFTALDLRDTRDPWRLRTARAVADSEAGAMDRYNQQLGSRNQMIQALMAGDLKQQDVGIDRLKAENQQKLIDAQTQALGHKFGFSGQPQGSIGSVVAQAGPVGEALTEPTKQPESVEEKLRRVSMSFPTGQASQFMQQNPESIAELMMSSSPQAPQELGRAAVNPGESDAGKLIAALQAAKSDKLGLARTNQMSVPGFDEGPLAKMFPRRSKVAPGPLMQKLMDYINPPEVIRMGQ